MAAVLRVKRRHDDEPLSALLIACKRMKTSENDEAEGATITDDPLTTVVQFAGTVNNREKAAVENLIQTLRKDELKETFKKHSVDILNKAREKTRQASAESRYKVVNYFRSLNSDVLKDSENEVTVIDVEDSVSCATGKQQAIEKDEKYVYDLYYGQTEDQVYLDDDVFIHPFHQELVFDNYRDPYPEAECESEDSNSESNWRNDYPDSDHSESDENDIRNAVRNMVPEDVSNLSSEDDFVYGVNEADLEKYGYIYAMYKAKIKKELGSSNSSDNSEVSEYSSSTSDNCEMCDYDESHDV